MEWQGLLEWTKFQKVHSQDHACEVDQQGKIEFLNCLGDLTRNETMDTASTGQYLIKIILLEISRGLS